MRLRPEQLGAHLKSGVAALYLVSGEETLLVEEALGAIRKAARHQGYHERECLTVDPRFDWNSLLAAANSLSLFGSRRLLELRLGDARPGETGGKVLQAYAERPAESNVLLVSGGKLDAAGRKSRWFTAFEETGIVVQVWPVAAQQLPAWIRDRMHRRGMQPTEEAIALLAERIEGNLLAAAQEIEKLFMLFGPSAITAEQLLAVVADSARYSIYDLVDAALMGQAERVVRILNGLQNEGVEPALISWALHREIRLLALLNFDIGGGMPLETALARHKVWDKRKPLLRDVLPRLTARACRRLLQDCARLDRVIKGAAEGNPGDELLALSLRLAGRKWLSAPGRC